MPGHKNLVHQSSTTTGTGNFTLAAVNGKQSFSTAFGTGSGNKFDYFISNRGGAEWERGIGYMSSSTVLVRDQVLESTNANAAVNFSAGTKDVTHDIPAGEQMRGPSSSTALAQARFTDTSGRILEGVAIGGKRLKAITRITASTTYNTPAGVTALLVKAVGAGGGGGGGDSTAGYGVGGGGGGGAYGEVWVASPASSYAVGIGSAGGGGGGSGASGSAGGDTTFGALLNLGGGSGGGGQTQGTTTAVAAGGAAGTVTTGGDRSHDGFRGGDGIRFAGSPRISGGGANGPFGAGGGSIVYNNTGSNQGGRSASGYGAGGGGAVAGNADQSGGAGSPGYVEVWEFVDW